jgi:transposase
MSPCSSRSGSPWRPKSSARTEDLFDPPGREGKPAPYPRRDVVDAILFLARTGCQWRYLPGCYPPWEAVW